MAAGSGAGRPAAQAGSIVCRGLSSGVAASCEVLPAQAKMVRAFTHASRMLVVGNSLLHRTGVRGRPASRQRSSSSVHRRRRRPRSRPRRPSVRRAMPPAIPTTVRTRGGTSMMSRRLYGRRPSSRPALQLPQQRLASQAAPMRTRRQATPDCRPAARPKLQT